MTAELRSSDSQYLRIGVLGYKFSDIEEGEEDSNTLVFRISVRTKERSWTARAELLTLDLGRMVRWMRDVAKKDPVEATIRTMSDPLKTAAILDFREPNLRFLFKGSSMRSAERRVKLRIEFDFYFGPYDPSHPRYSETTYLDIEIPRSQLLAFSEELEGYRRRFPPRGEWAVKPTS